MTSAKHNLNKGNPQINICDGQLKQRLLRIAHFERRTLAGATRWLLEDAVKEKEAELNLPPIVE